MGLISSLMQPRVANPQVPGQMPWRARRMVDPPTGYGPGGGVPPQARAGVPPVPAQTPQGMAAGPAPAGQIVPPDTWSRDFSRRARMQQY